MKRYGDEKVIYVSMLVCTISRETRNNDSFYMLSMSYYFFYWDFSMATELSKIIYLVAYLNA